MKVLIVGSGGREHALAWKASKSDLTTEIYVAPGNGGTEIEASIQNIDINANDIDSLSAFAKKEEDWMFFFRINKNNLINEKNDKLSSYKSILKKTDDKNLKKLVKYKIDKIKNE